MIDFEHLITLTLVLLTVYYISRTYGKRDRASLRYAAVMVLGDIGRSPRMMYHAESFARNGFQTYIIGNRGE